MRTLALIVIVAAIATFANAAVFERTCTDSSCGTCGTETTVSGGTYISDAKCGSYMYTMGDKNCGTTGRGYAAAVCGVCMRESATKYSIITCSGSDININNECTESTCSNCALKVKATSSCSSITMKDPSSGSSMDIGVKSVSVNFDCFRYQQSNIDLVGGTCIPVSNSGVTTWMKIRTDSATIASPPTHPPVQGAERVLSMAAVMIAMFVALMF